MPEPDDFAFWRDAARQLVQARIAPDQVAWSEPGSSGSLFAIGSTELPSPLPGAAVVKASKRFQSLARNAAVHSDPERFALLYEMLWRLQGNSRLMEDKADPLVRRIEEMDKAVRRDAHKMHAFVRFRKVSDEDANDHYVAWFEPDHHIVRREAGFFVRRFANMHWSILTPRGCLHWDGETLRESGPAQKADAPQGDPAEDLWRSYYASIFNPARLKIGAMLKEMPRKYWKNMPEAELIPQLIAGAQKRESQMVDAGSMVAEDRPESLEAIERAISACSRCPIGDLDNKAVMGEGPPDARLMIVGEQPGDVEDQQGRPFVGPAGQVLNAALEKIGLDREVAFVTNAVKHFKYQQRGKRRIHQSPNAKEIDLCRWWHEAEREIVKPDIVLALGASAGRAMLGRTVSISRQRGEPIALDDGSELWITAHPSYLLRLDGEAREKQVQLFEQDLRSVKERLAALAD
ncbi:UdgX family uracil-DNA binding protein [Aurantiacibacter gangjinensis]|uniref:Type-4 uracil-DNA glycosylase n=1 Tax=Aurantiacibacter gangjinensis TaxID=502682 RepID=A0A0G9MQE9_9SPHN|nr:UdgX family uracil-DNA binding protein [Aurantiacibacter gangjinensis]APE28608.1 Domain often clustered or fused with uracil-DNA glycosylase / Uracil-DNA glycosylase, putative family 6 [Aurantiacibacter gangjinensis]KLE32794.1 DNA polymerase [Aurantiacibacter gangjinensis]